MKIASLQNLSTFTLLESPTKITDLLSAAKNKGYESVALTDINVTYGLVNFYEQAKKVGIKPILGMQVRINGLIDSANKYDLIVLAKNNNGYKNILKLSSAINLLTENGENDKVLTLTELKKYLEDLVIIVPANEHSELLITSRQNEALGSDYIRDLKKLIPAKSDLYLGVYANKNQENYYSYVQSLAKQFELPMVATEDNQYLNPRDQFARKALLAIKHGDQLHDALALSKQKGSHYLVSAQELLMRYHEFYL